MHDVGPLVLGVLGALLSLVFVWRGYLYLIDSPPCAELSEVAGPAEEVALERRFYSAQWLSMAVEGQQLYLPASPFVRASVAPLRSGRHAVAGFCPSPGGSRLRLWELSIDGRTLLDLAAWRTFASGQVRVMGAASVLSLSLAGFGFRLARHGGTRFCI